MSISKNKLLVGVLVFVVALIVLSAGAYMLYSQANPADVTQQEEATPNNSEAPPTPTSVEDLELVSEASQSGSEADDPNQVIESPTQEVESATDSNQASASAAPTAPTE